LQPVLQRRSIRRTAIHRIVSTRHSFGVKQPIFSQTIVNIVCDCGRKAGPHRDPSGIVRNFLRRGRGQIPRRDRQPYQRFLCVGTHVSCRLGEEHLRSTAGPQLNARIQRAVNTMKAFMYSWPRKIGEVNRYKVDFNAITPNKRTDDRSSCGRSRHHCSCCISGLNWSFKN
jgi:hypothetical protein